MVRKPPRDDLVRISRDMIGCIQAMQRGAVRVVIAMGGSFARATPDSDATEAALRKCALILPTLGRTERDRTGDIEQFVTVEDSMGSSTPPEAACGPPRRSCAARSTSCARSVSVPSMVG